MCPTSTGKEERPGRGGEGRGGGERGRRRAGTWLHSPTWRARVDFIAGARRTHDRKGDFHIGARRVTGSCDVLVSSTMPTLTNSAHEPGYTCIAFSRDGRYACTPLFDSLSLISPLGSPTLGDQTASCEYGIWTRISTKSPKSLTRRTKE